jgi:multidrug efflux system outer membrane protein
MRALRILGWLAGAIVVAGCTVGPDFVKPAVDAPPAWRIDEAQAADAANTRWWEQFDDPVLTGLVATALRDNRDLVIAAARVDAFIGTLATTRNSLGSNRVSSGRPGVAISPGSARRRATIPANGATMVAWLLLAPACAACAAALL